MRTDLAALTPPLVMAAAFIAGVVALLRSQMAPRRGGDLTVMRKVADDRHLHLLCHRGQPFYWSKPISGAKDIPSYWP